MRFLCLALAICFYVSGLPVVAITNKLETDVLIIGGSQSGVMAAIQAARMGSKVTLVTQDEWLGGSMIEAGVSAIDGNELLPFQSGLWGEFLGYLADREPNLMKYGWVSLFTFHPHIGREILEDWLFSEPNITWLKNLAPKKILWERNLHSKSKIRKVIGIQLSNNQVIKAKVTVDATETGDLLDIGRMQYRLGWELQGEFNEPSAPKTFNEKRSLINRFPVQELSWVFFLKDYRNKTAPVVPEPIGYSYEKASERFWCAFNNESLLEGEDQYLFSNKWRSKYKDLASYKRNYSANSFLTYGQIAPDLFMINWPQCGNDYSEGILRLFSQDKQRKEEFLKESYTHSLWFARYIQDTLGRRYGLAKDIFPSYTQFDSHIPGFALIPYHREARRMVGLETMNENDLVSGSFAVFNPDSVAVANYPNDHHYYELARPQSRMHFKPDTRAMKWGGRYTGKAFSIPLDSLIPVNIDGFLVAEKSISVSHIANGSTRLQPACMQVGQAVGAIASLAAINSMEPYEINPQEIQSELLNSRSAPLLVPLYDLNPDNQYKNSIQRLILTGIIPFPEDGLFHPDQTIDADDLYEWLENAKLPYYEMLKGYSRGRIAHYIESKVNALNATHSAEEKMQYLPEYRLERYCGQLQSTNNQYDSFRLVNARNEWNNKIIRRTPSGESVANNIGVITLDASVYQDLQRLSPAKPQVCIDGVFNHSGIWITAFNIIQK